jgi:hypothetical protein
MNKLHLPVIVGSILLSFLSLPDCQASNRVFTPEWDQMIILKHGVRYYVNPRMRDHEGLVRFGTFKSPYPTNRIPLLIVNASTIFCSLVDSAAYVSDDELIATEFFYESKTVATGDRLVHLWGRPGDVPQTPNREIYNNSRLEQWFVEYYSVQTPFTTKVMNVIGCVDQTLQNDPNLDWSAYSLQKIPMPNHLFYLPVQQMSATLPFLANGRQLLSWEPTTYRLLPESGLSSEKMNLKTEANREDLMPNINWICRAAGLTQAIDIVADWTQAPVLGPVLSFDPNGSGSSFTTENEDLAAGLICK